jgi:hypothetical protein
VSLDDADASIDVDRMSATGPGDINVAMLTCWAIPLREVPAELVVGSTGVESNTGRRLSP